MTRPAEQIFNDISECKRTMARAAVNVSVDYNAVGIWLSASARLVRLEHEACAPVASYIARRAAMARRAVELVECCKEAFVEYDDIAAKLGREIESDALEKLSRRQRLQKEIQGLRALSQKAQVFKTDLAQLHSCVVEIVNLPLPMGTLSVERGNQLPHMGQLRSASAKMEKRASPARPSRDATVTG